MADLLECLLQIKGLRHSVDRLAALAEKARAGGDQADLTLTRTVDDLLAAERRWQAVLARALPGRGWIGGSAASPEPAGTVGAFRLARLFTLEILDSASAEDLAAATSAPGLGHVTVADIVAHMLAYDTERLGALRAVLREGA